MINVKKTFLKLTTKLYPYGTEDEIIDLLTEFHFQKDEFGNYFIIVKKDDNTFSDTMFTCHLDTVLTKLTYVDKSLKVKQIEYDDFIKTDGSSNLGADDKAGLVVLLYMISENVPGLYYFFIGEEIGRLGSDDLSKKFNKYVNNGILPKINRCISFDRRGYNMITTAQQRRKCCSDFFAKEIARRYNEYGFWYDTDDNGGRTDSYQFIDLIPECTNISVGYFNEHTVSEVQDIEFLKLLCLTSSKINWDDLPTKRKILDYDMLDREYNKWFY